MKTALKRFVIPMALVGMAFGHLARKADATPPGGAANTYVYNIRFAQVKTAGPYWSKTPAIQAKSRAKLKGLATSRIYRVYRGSRATRPTYYFRYGKLVSRNVRLTRKQASVVLHVLRAKFNYVKVTRVR